MLRGASGCSSFSLSMFSISGCKLMAYLPMRPYGLRQRK
jgi:hypothetical protein